jgi:hypothetical protein
LKDREREREKERARDREESGENGRRDNRVTQERERED